MEMYDLPIRAAFCNNERDTTIGTEWLSVPHASHIPLERRDLIAGYCIGSVPSQLAVPWECDPLHFRLGAKSGRDAL